MDTPTNAAPQSDPPAPADSANIYADADAGAQGAEGAGGANTDPKTVWVGVLQSAQSAVIPALLVSFSSGGMGLVVAIPILAGIMALGSLFSYLNWKRLTYTIEAQDIRVESGLLSRSARSVPYERIQDVSLEQKLLPRLLGLVAVKFETGAGGGDDLSLAYLTEARGEELRQLVRERHAQGEDVTQAAPGESQFDAAPQSASRSALQTSLQAEPEAQTLFTMGPRRLFTYGLFQFSLAVFAVLAGLAQYADNLFDFELWDADQWQSMVEQYGPDWGALDTSMQVIGALVAIIGLVMVGSLTGMIRVFAREWGFVLERTARGFRRRRGLFTRTDVVMPVHRVQGIKLGTGFVRYRFGWHGLSFVSLAQDMGASSHAVAPFAKLDEIAPIVRAAGFELPGEDADWCRASERYMFDSAVLNAGFFLVLAAIAGIAAAIRRPEWMVGAVGALLVLAGLAAILTGLAWRFHRHALDPQQIMATRGLLAPQSQIAARVKLHSVEIAQGPLARMRGYATVYLGQAGGGFAIPGVPIERARQLRAKVMETIAATDFSRLENG